MRELLTIKEVSETLKVAEGTLRDWVQYRRIPFVRVGRLVRFRPGDIERIQAEGLVVGAT
ncbi:MAG TPA: helix-turn-helix domain-containing protein [Candidatus Hypogeohydataceae bacterium YC38]|nr:helix-turn-helix domain-containing protein [Candidatus Brocadiales bacterium]